MPASVPLKPLSLDGEQKDAIAALQRTANHTEGNQIVTSRRFGLLTSLGLHLIAALVATLYIVQAPSVDDDAIIVELTKIRAAPKTKRRLPPRKIKSVTPPKSLRIRTTQLRRPTTTAVEIPSEDARFTIPGDNLSIPTDAPSDGGVSIAEGLDKNLVENYRAEIPSTMPKIKLQRSTSILSKIELEPPPDLELVDRPIEAPSDGLQPPRFVKKVEPKYPEFARRAQKEGVVVLEATIGVDGMARDIQVAEALGLGCDEAAVTALKTSRFAPAKRGEEVIALRIRIPYRFTLEE